MTAAMVLMAAFASCKKDSSDDSGNPDNSFIINATNVINTVSNISTVKAVMYDYNNGNEYTVASCKYENNGFTLTLPGTVPEKYINGISEENFEGTISDPKAKIGGIRIYACDFQGKTMGDFFYMSDNFYFILYYYADRDVTIQGHGIIDADKYYGDVEYDLSLEKGWNIVYEKATIHGEDIDFSLTTQKPSDIDFKWYYSPNGIIPFSKKIPL